MSNKKTLGPVSAKLIASLYDMGKPIFTIVNVMDVTGLSRTKAADLTSELVKREIIVRIKEGKFLIIPQELGESIKYIGNWYVVAREIVNSSDYYISFYSAMEIHNMVTHPLTKVYISTPVQQYKKILGIRNVEFEFIYTSKQNIWGIENYWATKSEKVRVSDVEKTIIDCLYRPKYCGGILEIIKGIWFQRDKIDFDRLLSYSLKFDKNIVIKRLGYILESLKLVESGNLSKLRIKVNNKYYVLDPLLPTDETFKNSWKIIANIGREEIVKAVST
jgi:predicted transcriptional regulator of viral defense system